mmetsp:Transcript_76713/g.204819  ORF Transcript_76713/g.204819 Transcript_76713/m.204819 type:complete len:87 (+) Transcript_76713:679-939(+)
MLPAADAAASFCDEYSPLFAPALGHERQNLDHTLQLKKPSQPSTGQPKLCVRQHSTKPIMTIRQEHRWEVAQWSVYRTGMNPFRGV